MMKTFLLVAVLVAAAVAASTSQFDVRNKWSCPYQILEQGGCSDCWNFCSVEAFADRLCAANEGKPTLSPMPVLECNGKQGCGGGVPGTAWGYLINSGTTTCAHTANTQKNCNAGCSPIVYHQPPPSCHYGKCDNGQAWPKTYKAASFKGLPKNAISTYQHEIQNNGPIQMCYTVYSNFDPFFANHPTGIYTAASGSSQGGHCVKLVGWGTSGSTDYWTFANSWGTTWGDKGYFKMKRGINLCGIENQVSVGYAKGQSEALNIPLGVDEEMLNSTFIVGGWEKQEDLDQDLYFLIAKSGLKDVAKKENQTFTLSRIAGVETQVVQGRNYKILVATKEGINVEMTVWRDTDWELNLMEHQIFLN